MKILVIQTRDIGDVLLSTALCNALKRERPEATVEMLTLDISEGVVRGNPNIDRVVVLERKRRNDVGANLALARKLRAARYDVVINVQGQIIGLLACLASGAKTRIGFDKSPWRTGHTVNVPFRQWSGEGTGAGRTLDDRFALLEPLGLEPKERTYRIWLSDAERAHGKALLEHAGLDTGRPIVAFAINAGDDWKRWPLGHFATAAERLIQRYGVQVLACFGPGEEEYTRGLRAALPEASRADVFDTLKCKDIRELACVFAHCALYVGNDTGPRHIAQSLDVPALALVAPPSEKRDWIPWDHPRFRALDVADALGIEPERWAAMRFGEERHASLPDFAELGADFVCGELERMVRDLDLFGAPVSA